MIRLIALAVGVWLTLPTTQSVARPPIRGLTATPAVRRAYDTILDADFLNVPARLSETCALSPSERGLAPPEVCSVLDALAVWWEISVDPDSRLRDARFTRAVERAIADTGAWTRREPERAEAWFYLGVAHGARTQWRVLRQERFAAARDGKKIKAALEQALALDPDMHDANFGIGMYRYYADVTPGALRMLRWLLLLPGGDRESGLAQMTDARNHGQLVQGEADYQLHLIYLWYEKRTRDALTLVQGLQARYPRNFLFHHIEAEIQDVYLHDAVASYAASARLLALATDRNVYEPAIASVRARLNMATQLARLGERPRAIDLLNALIAERPARPHGSTARAQALLTAIGVERRGKN